MLARTHKTLIWERTRHVQRLRHQLREYFPAALEAFDDLDAARRAGTAGQGPGPGPGRKLTRAQSTSALKRARRHHIAGQDDSDPRGAAWRAAGPAPARHRRVRCHRPLPDRGDRNPPTSRSRPSGAGGVKPVGEHPDAEIYLSQPGLGASSAPGCSANRHDPHRYPDARARKNYAATSPITRASGKKKIVAAQFIHNDRLIDALMAQAFGLDARPAPAPSTTTSAPAAPNTTTRSGGWPTGLSASCTDASRPPPSTTRRPRGRIAR